MTRHAVNRPFVPWGAGGEILADQLTLSQPRGPDYANQIILAPPDFQTFQRPWSMKDENKGPINFGHLSFFLLSV